MARSSNGTRRLRSAARALPVYSDAGIPQSTCRAVIPA